MPPITTRLATSADIQVVAVLFDAYRQFYQQAPDLAAATQFITDRILRKESVVFIAENHNKECLGFCQMYPTFCSVEAAPIYTLYDLFVSPHTRRSGAGRALLLAVQAHAQQNGYVRMDLTTAKTNLQAQALYESLGWVRDNVFYAYSRTLQGS
jgi:ribosomal protein S18 acetylase RimI-like enzyme